MRIILNNFYYEVKPEISKKIVKNKLSNQYIKNPIKMTKFYKLLMIGNYKKFSHVNLSHDPRAQ